MTAAVAWLTHSANWRWCSLHSAPSSHHTALTQQVLSDWVYRNYQSGSHKPGPSLHCLVSGHTLSKHCSVLSIYASAPGHTPLTPCHPRGISRDKTTGVTPPIASVGRLAVMLWRGLSLTGHCVCSWGLSVTAVVTTRALVTAHWPLLLGPGCLLRSSPAPALAAITKLPQAADICRAGPWPRVHTRGHSHRRAPQQ